MRVFVIAGFFFIIGLFSRGLSPYSLQKGFAVAIENCDSVRERTKAIVCFKKEITSLVKQYGVRNTMNQLEKLFTGSSSNTDNLGGFSRCHDIAHAIGQASQEYRFDLTDSLGSCTSLCTSGCYHGVIEGFIARGGDLENMLPSICRSTSMNHTDKPACFHGVGHGLASISGYNLLSSLAQCDEVEEPGRADCGAGVIMELYEPSSFDHALLNFPNDIPGFCRTLKEPYQKVCEQTAGLHEYSRTKDVTKGISVCFQVSMQVRDDCFVALGQNMYFVYEDDIQAMTTLCSSHGDIFIRPCRKGILAASVMSDPEYRYASLFCEQIGDKENCKRELLEMTKQKQ